MFSHQVGLIRKVSNIFFGTVFIIFSLSGCAGLTHEINKKLQSGQGILQNKRAITLSEENLEKLDRLDLIVFVTKNDLDLVAKDTLKKFNASEAALKNGIHFKDVQIKLAPQRLSVDANIEKKFGDVTLSLNAQISGIVGALSNGLHWNLYLDGVRVKKISGKGKVVGTLGKTITNWVLSLNLILNAILDEAINEDPEDAILVLFDKKDFLEIHLSDLADGSELFFNEKIIRTALQVEATAILITSQGIALSNKIKFTDPNDFVETKTSFPNEDELLRQSTKGVKHRISQFQNSFYEKLNTLSSGSINRNLIEYRTGMVISRGATQSLLNHQFRHGPINGILKTRKIEKSESSITFEIKNRDCENYLKYCDFKNICTGNRCERKVTRTIEGICDAYCCSAFNFWGCLSFKKACKKACKKTVIVTEPIIKPHCKAFRAADKLHAGLLCNSVSNIDKAVCDLGSVGKAALCEAEQGIRDYYSRNPIASIKMNTTADIGLSFKITDAQLSQNLNRASLILDARGNADISANIEYDRHNYTTAILLPSLSLGVGCATDWHETINFTVSTHQINKQINFNISNKNNVNGNLIFEFTDKSPSTLFINMNPSPLAAIFGDKPHLAINCPLTAIGGVVIASADAIINKDDIKNYAPLLTGKNYPIMLEKVQFEIKIKPIDLCKSFSDKKLCNEGHMTAYPEMTNYGLVFSTQVNR